MLALGQAVALPMTATRNTMAAATVMTCPCKALAFVRMPACRSSAR
jgi:hypothetical protein